MDSFKAILHPFNTIDQLMFALKIGKKMNGFLDSSKVRTINKFLKINVSIEQYSKFNNKVDNFKEFYPINFIETEKSIDEFINSEINFNYSEYEFAYEGLECLICKQKLNFCGYLDSIYYSYNNGPKKAKINIKYCKLCKTRHLLSFYVKKNGERFFYNNVIFKDLISFTNETLFDVKLLDCLTTDIIFKHSSFSAFANAYNYLFINKTVDSLFFLNDKRLTESWYYYRYLNFLAEFGKTNIEAFHVNKLNDSIQKINIFLFRYFIQKWNGPFHRFFCLNIDCSKTFTIDGNQKTGRLKCFYEKTCYNSVEFGLIQIGCPNTPLKNSYFCEKHAEEDPKFNFKYKDGIYQCCLSQIKLKKGRIFSHQSIQIHDLFDHQEGIFFLCDYSNEKIPFWVSENQLNKSEVDQFMKIRKANCNQENIEYNSSSKLTEPCNHKSKTDGIFLGCYNCNIIASFKEIYSSESVPQASIFCLETFDCMYTIPDHIVYDLGCKMKKFINNKQRIKTETTRLNEFQQKAIVVDRFHFQKHSQEDYFCRENCDADKYSELNGINTSVCEEINFWLSGYKHM
ncbi:hypothetical protein BpHYR1_001525, partial [Brachionus plicatilis]